MPAERRIIGTVILLLSDDPRDDPGAADAGTLDWLQHLQTAMPDETIFTMWSDYEPENIDIAVMVRPPKGSLSQLTELRWIHSLWAGIEHLLTDSSIPADIPIVRLEDPHMAHTIAESATMHVLRLHRKMPEYRLQQNDGAWKDLGYRETTDTRVGILGLGLMGEAAARMIAGIGFRVMGWSRSRKDIAGVESFTQEHLADMLAQTDILVNLLPLTDATTGIINRETIAQLPAGAEIVNLGRGPHIVDSDLLAALDSGHIHHAALDVFAVEPLPTDHPYWAHPRVTVTPHVAAPTGRPTGAAIVAGNVARYRRDGKIPPAVDRARGY